MKQNDRDVRGKKGSKIGRKWRKLCRKVAYTICLDRTFSSVVKFGSSQHEEVFLSVGSVAMTVKNFVQA